MNESSYGREETLTWANLYLRHFLQNFLGAKVKPGKDLYTPTEEEAMIYYDGS